MPNFGQDETLTYWKGFDGVNIKTLTVTMATVINALTHYVRAPFFFRAIDLKFF